jgi:hypothetical protein
MRGRFAQALPHLLLNSGWQQHPHKNERYCSDLVKLLAAPV